jgi:hypothetical protein
MKKLALILAIMMIPCAAFGLQIMDNSSLDEVTGQYGVSIAADDIQIFLNVERFAYIDCDGYETLLYGGDCSSHIGAAIAVDNFQMDTLNINMIGARGDSLSSANGETNQTENGGLAPALAGSSCGVIDLFYDYGTEGTTGCALDGAGSVLGLENYTNTNQYTTWSGFLTKSMTINVTGALPLHSAGLRINKGGTLNNTQTAAGVLIGLPTMEIYIHDMSFDPTVTADITSNTAAQKAQVVNNNESFGKIQMQGVTFSLLNGFVEFAPIGDTND